MGKFNNIAGQPDDGGAVDAKLALCYVRRVFADRMHLGERKPAQAVAAMVLIPRLAWLIAEPPPGVLKIGEGRSTARWGFRARGEEWGA